MSNYGRTRLEEELTNVRRKWENINSANRIQYNKDLSRSLEHQNTPAPDPIIRIDKAMIYTSASGAMIGGFFGGPTGAIVGGLVGGAARGVYMIWEEHAERQLVIDADTL